MYVRRKKKEKRENILALDYTVQLVINFNWKFIQLNDVRNVNGIGKIGI